MIRLIGFRHLLPPVQLLLYGVRCLSAYWGRQAQGPCMYLWSSSQSNVLAQEGDTIELPPPCRTFKTELIAGSLNLPAQLAGMALAEMLAVTLHREGDLWTSAASAPMVVILWYWVGFWIDRRLGYVGLRKSRFHLPRILAKLARVFSILTVIFSAILIVRALLSQGHLEVYVVTGSFTCWTVFLLVATSSTLRRSGVLSSGGGSFSN